MGGQRGNHVAGTPSTVTVSAWVWERTNHRLASMMSSVPRYDVIAVVFIAPNGHKSYAVVSSEVGR